ncbi:amylo-alpha-1,6-glucosidase [Fuchsiella alkaliacetigena]|uniref:amylo-alpha-1,6-glucosidase n=1 Tax=Fuchsiella alkaliacetigena TaxID=957042 RepID=UPI00200B9B44|nr:amylo-alpha-1,6-glucosidase [Fuchsiella alkaliacetigena]MCK8824858.1 amylo-alpha-1,6-glucosidase [Fuchsiella alkaliacetigena]
MHYSYSREELSDLESSLQKEWLLTNGLGGFAAATINGALTRRYHGLLIAALEPPVERYLLLSKVEAEVSCQGNDYQLSTNQYRDTVHPQGYKYLQQFELAPLPTYTYNLAGNLLEKKIFMVEGENTTVIRYRNLSQQRMKLRLRPLLNCRDYHSISKGESWSFNWERLDNELVFRAYSEAPKLYLHLGKADYTAEGDWHLDFKYPVEERRGLDYLEDHFNPGVIELELAAAESYYLVASTARIGSFAGAEELKKAVLRKESLASEVDSQSDFVNSLAVAADDFIVHRESTGTKTVIAGYPWFTDWGRDTMIALPGLCLVTGKQDTAREILSTFAHYVEAGLLPNRFPDYQQEPVYNTVDAPLWFFYAVDKYLEYTADYDSVKEGIYSVLKQIIYSYQEGTKYNIYLDQDYLISAGCAGVQLTWMDAKVDDWVVTPRHGKAVEINALWYNALRVTAKLAAKYGELSVEKEMLSLAEQTAESFKLRFWNEELGALYDLIGTGGEPEAKLRPNQIFAVSLPYTMLEDEQARQVVSVVKSKLYTTYGLRSLAATDSEYIGQYSGDQYSRDAAYHQGTAWSWLIGHFITAYLKVNDYSAASQETAAKMVAPFRAHLHRAGINSISEVFTGDYPHSPRGCFAQAWSVAELLRVLVEDLGY